MTLEPLQLPRPRRSRGRRMLFGLAVAACVVGYAVLVLQGCGGGHHGPKPPPVPTPIATPGPLTHAVTCGSYAYEASPEDMRALAATGVTAVLDYIDYEICERTAGVPLGIILPLYFGRADSAATIDPVIAAAQHTIAPCRERLVGLYVADEPALKAIPAALVNLQIAAVQRAFPGVPTLIYEPRDSDFGRYPALDRRGLSFYSHDAQDAAKVRKRLARQPHARGEQYAIVARGFVERGTPCCGGAYGRWRDADVADAIRVLAAAARETSHVTLLVPYLFQEPAGVNPAPNLGWRDLPLARAAMREVCR